MTRRIATCALIPHAGHLTPLFAVARHLAARGDEVRAFLPDEGARVAERFGVEFETFGAVLAPDYARLIDRAARASRWAFQAYWGVWLAMEYIVPVKAQGTRLAAELLSRLRRYEPDLLLADDHLFVPEYRWLAGQLGIPLVLNHSAGSNFADQPCKFWLNVDSERAERVGSWIRALEYSFEKRFRRGRQRRVREDLKQIEDSRAARATGPEPPRLERLCMGLGALEIEQLGDRIDHAGGMHRFQSPSPQIGGEMDQDLADWLENAEVRSVLYVASGTMARIPVRQLTAMTRDALRAGLRVLVADGGGRFSWSGDSGWVLVKRWVPQTAVLAHRSIGAFVTHAGANSIQEALWNGVPVLCRPLLWDQHYNAWVAEQLGFGLCLDVSGMPRERFALRLRRLLDSPSFREAAQRIGAAARAAPGELGAAALIDHMLDVSRSVAQSRSSVC